MSVHQAQIFLDLLSVGGNAGTWSYHTGTQRFVADANTCMLMRCPGTADIALADFLTRVKTDDRAALAQDLHTAIESQGAFVRTFQLQDMGDTVKLTMRARWSALPDATEGALFGVVERSLLSTLQSQAVQHRFDHLRSLREQQLLIVFERAPVPICLSRLSDGVFVQVNTQFLKLFGYSMEEVLGSGSLGLNLWLQPEDRYKMLEELKAHGNVDNLVTGYRHKSGRTGRVQMSVELIDVGGDSLLLGVLSDIGEMEEARRSMAQSEARYKLLSEASFEGVGLARDGIVIDANEQIARILGVTRDQLIGKPVTRNMKPTDQPKALQALRTGGDSHNEYEYLRPDGQQVIVEVRSKDLFQDGEVLRISALRDVTEKRQKELALQNLQLRFSSLMQSNVVGIFIAGPDGEIFESNDYFLNMLGLDRKALEAGELNWQTLTARDTMDITMNSVQKMTQSGGTLPYEKVYLHTDGRRVTALVALSQLSIAPVRGIVIVLDISDLKATQSALMERTQAAEHAEAAKTLFLSSVSHELRTPLHTMLGHVRLMRKKASGEDLQQLSVVERSSTHLLRLIEDLLEYNHTMVAPERLEPDGVMLDGFLSSVQLIASAVTADSDNQFFMQLSDELPTTMVVDEVRLTQVLRILMDNACKYTRAGSLIFSLSCEGVKRAVDGVERCNLRFSVEDNGRGIDPADVAHIYEPLYRGSNAADLHGLGLGLAIAARWIKRMGSTIVVETSRGFGSNFSFVLDLAVSFEAVPSSRELLRKSPLSPQSAQATVHLHPLPQEDLNTLGELINMGRLGRLRDWAQALEMRYPQHRKAAVAVGELAANADLEALEKLHGRWAAMGCLNESNTTLPEE